LIVEDSKTMSPFRNLSRLHREACPTRSDEQRDSELKRRFEDGLSNVEMAQYQRLHARDCDFAATVLMLMLMFHS